MRGLGPLEERLVPRLHGAGQALLHRGLRIAPDVGQELAGDRLLGDGGVMQRLGGVPKDLDGGF